LARATRRFLAAARGGGGGGGGAGAASADGGRLFWFWVIGFDAFGGRRRS
jgi:hypothetical protein